MADTLGSLLRKKRESLGLTLEKVEGFTHIRVKHLQAIESDDLSAIPSVVQARGFIRNYATFLGLNPDEVSGRIGATVPRPEKPAPPSAAEERPPAPAQSPAPAPASSRPRAPITAPVVPRTAGRVRSRPAGRAWLRMDALLGAAVTLVVVALLGWGGYQIALSVKGSPSPTAAPAAATPVSPVAASQTAPPDGGTPEITPGPTETGGAGPAQTEPGAAITPGTLSVATLSPTAFPTPLGGVYTDVRIHIVVAQRAFLEVEVDAAVKFSGRVLPGETHDFIGRQTVKVSTGNGAGIQIVYNGVDEGKMGGFGEAVSRTYTPTGILEPAVAPTATPTVTPTPTSTKSP